LDRVVVHQAVSASTFVTSDFTTETIAHLTEVDRRIIFDDSLQPSWSPCIHHLEEWKIIFEQNFPAYILQHVEFVVVVRHHYQRLEFRSGRRTRKP
jgi:hypothetical protein